MKEENMVKKVQVWQTIVLVELLVVIFLGLYANYLRGAFAAQTHYLAQIEKTMVVQDKREKELTARLMAVMGLLQRAVNDLNQGQAAGVVNNAPVPEAVAQ